MNLFGDDLPDPVGDHQVPGSESPPPRARTPRTRDRLDLDDWEVPTPPSGSRRWLLAAAVVPWVVVVAVMLAGNSSADPAEAPAAPEGHDPTPTTATPTGAGATSSSVEPRSEPAGDPATARTAAGDIVALGGARGPSRRGEAEGLAVVVARSWLSARPAGPGIAGLEPAPGAADRYVEHLAVESVDHPARGEAVVTVRAVVLPVEGESYGAPRQLRVAVPVVLDADAPRLAGTPWLLAVPELELAEPARAPVDDVDLQIAAAEAITLAGYREVELTSLERTDGWAAIAVVTARAPGEDGVRAHEVWLRPDVGRLVVAGTTAPPAGAPPPSAGSPEPDRTETTPTADTTPTPDPETSR